MESKLGLNFDLVNEARASAAHVAADVQCFIDLHTTVTVSMTWTFPCRTSSWTI